MSRDDRRPYARRVPPPTRRGLSPRNGEIPDRELDLALDAVRTELAELRREVAAIECSRAWRMGHALAGAGYRLRGRRSLTGGAPGAALARIDRLLEALPVLRAGRNTAGATGEGRAPDDAERPVVAAAIAAAPVASLVPWPGEWDVARAAAAGAGCAIETLVPAGAGVHATDRPLPAPAPARRWHAEALAAAACERIVLMAPGARRPAPRWLASLDGKLPVLLAGVGLVATRADIERAGGLARWHETREAFAGLARRLGIANSKEPTASVAIVVGTRDQASARGGDLPFAEGMARSLSASGRSSIVLALDDAAQPRARSAQVALHVRGRARRILRGDQLNVLWIISHPDEVNDDECAAYDLVCAAGAPLTEALRRRTACSVLLLEQATDPSRFRPVGPRTRDVVFVGNAVGRTRPVIETIARAGVDLHLWGRGWTGSAARHLRGDHVPHSDLPALYASARVVLNDTWPDMRRAGIVPNRVFDALACGACVVSDSIAGAGGRFGGALRTSADPAGLRAHVLDLLDNPDAASAMGLAAAEQVRREHGFDERARRLLAVLEGGAGRY